jgi:integrase
MRLLILTGARLREILHLQWEHVDFKRGMLLLPDSKTGRKVIVLNAPALDVLANLPRVGGYVIAGNRAGTEEEQPRADLKRPWQAVAAHLPPEQYAYRPGRNAQQAVVEVDNCRGSVATSSREIGPEPRKSSRAPI